MTHTTLSSLIQTKNRAGGIVLGMVLAAGVAVSAYGQGIIASGTISGSGSGPYSYSLSFSDSASATTAVGSVWYAWVPGSFFLPSSPTGASAPSGWTANINGNSVQYTANSPANYIQPGGTLPGFGYTATFSPAQLAAAPNSGESVAYSAGLFSAGAFTFVVSAVPEPSTLALLVGGVAAWGLARRRSHLVNS